MKYILSLLALIVFCKANAQPAPFCGQPSVITYADPADCSSPCVTLHAQVTSENPQNAGITIDDTYSGVIPIGFNFSFFGKSFNQCIIGANGMITFDTTFAGFFNPWNITASLLGNANALNSICGAWFDMDVSIGTVGTITFATSGTAPRRRFTATWCNVPLYNADSCPNLRGTTQIILYETCNFIDVHVGSKPLCTNWNTGSTIIGVQNDTGNKAVTAPGRDFPSQYTCINEAWRFTPIAGNTYNVAAIPYHPVPNSNQVKWYKGATLVDSGATICVPFGFMPYKAQVAGCNSVSSSVIVPTYQGPAYSTIKVMDLCVGDTTAYTLTLPPGGNWNGGNPGIAINDVGSQSMIGMGQGTTMYTYFSPTTPCTHTIQVNVKFCCEDTCAWLTDGNKIVGNKNVFGTRNNKDIRIITNNVHRAIIESGGFMGIKQLSPTTTLNVDCVPPGSGVPSGLRLENLPVGYGKHIVVDPAGYVYLEGPYYSAMKQDNDGGGEQIAGLQQKIDKQQQEIDELRLQLSLLGSANSSGYYSLTIVPNPTDGRMTASYKIDGTFKAATIKVMDSRGRMLATHVIEGSFGNINIDLPDSVAPGNIIVALVVDGKAVATQKVALMR